MKLFISPCKRIIIKEFNSPEYTGNVYVAERAEIANGKYAREINIFYCPLMKMPMISFGDTVNFLYNNDFISKHDIEWTEIKKYPSFKVIEE